eukprot:SAG11_NODE_461_length_9234_cov_10.929611_5_plen_169_part_00
MDQVGQNAQLDSQGSLLNQQDVGGHGTDDQNSQLSSQGSLLNQLQPANNGGAEHKASSPYRCNHTSFRLTFQNPLSVDIVGTRPRCLPHYLHQVQQRRVRAQPRWLSKTWRGTLISAGCRQAALDAARWPRAGAAQLCGISRPLLAARSVSLHAIVNLDLAALSQHPL